MKPEINPDGWWCQCPCCWEEVYPRQDKCCKCGQLLDWSWLKEKDAEKMLNWKVRFNKKNILFIAQVIISVVIPVLAYFGLQASDLTTWSKVWETFVQAISNPYVVVMAIVSLFNAVTDPTTKGISDSTSALSYTQPK